PHFWTDPDRVRAATGLIAAQVIEHVDGVDAAAVRANTARYDRQLADLTAWMETSFERIPEDRRALVTNHHVFGYLADRFGFRVIGAVVPSGTTLASPSSVRSTSASRAGRDESAKTVRTPASRMASVSERRSDELGDGVRVVALHSESLTARGGGAATYLQMMRTNTTAMTDGLTAAP
ncbi:metal ABC transporter substrate-binding protein, partial [Streptomyces sp. t39]|uniref:metal ABC transporter substrate-binding protein n=1 Tax=Streptomyces sp. t39 TaxID=1828156 RepID=UPI0011CDAF1E